MMKRILAMILAVILLASNLSVKTYASTETTNIIVECNGEKKYYAVIDTGTDLLFKGEDLENITGYSYKVETNDAWFSRGSKKIRIDTSKDRLYPMESISKLNHVDLNGGVQKKDGSYYFSGAYLLPWLNVSCCVEEGVLKVTTDITSIWEVIPQFEPEEFEFDFLKCCEELGKESKYVKAAAYILGKGISGMFWDVIPYLGDSIEYYDLFENAVLDQSSTKESVDELIDDAEGIDYWMGIAEDYEVEEYLPDELKTIGGFASILSKSSAALELALYYTAICEHSDSVLSALYSMELNSDFYNLPDSVSVAVVDIRENFSDFNSALSDKLVLAVGEGALDVLVDKTTGLFKYAIDLVGLAEIKSPEWTEGVNRIELYNVISKYCLEAYRGNINGTHKDTIRDARGLAYMYLYACEQNYRTMASYAKEKGNADMQKKYNEIADKAEEWQVKFLSTSLSEENDSHEYGDGHGNKKEQYTDKLLGNFLVVERLDENVEEYDNVPVKQVTDTYVHSIELGNTVYSDLDGEEGEEEISVFIENEECFIKINENIERIGYLDNPTGYYTIVNLNEEENYVVIGVSQYGPSNDPYTILYRYNGTEIIELGQFDDILGEAEWESSATCDGKGNIYAITRIDALSTWRGNVHYKLENNTLKNMTEFYEYNKDRWNYLGEWKITNKCDLICYEEMGNLNAEKIISTGDTLKILGCQYDDYNVCWIACESELNNFNVWIRMETWDEIETPWGLQNMYDVFDGVGYCD